MILFAYEDGHITLARGQACRAILYNNLLSRIQLFKRCAVRKVWSDMYRLSSYWRHSYYHFVVVVASVAGVHINGCLRTPTNSGVGTTYLAELTVVCEKLLVDTHPDHIRAEG